MVHIYGPYDDAVLKFDKMCNKAGGPSSKKEFEMAISKIRGIIIGSGAWKAADDNPDLAYNIGSKFYKEGNYEFAKRMFVYAYKNASRKVKYESSMRMILYYTKVDHDEEKREIWTERALQLKPDGEALDVLANMQSTQDGDWESAFFTILRALEYGKNDDRKSATLAALKNALRKDVEEANPLSAKEKVNSFRELLPEMTERLFDEIGDDVQEILDGLERQNKELRSKVETLRDKIESKDSEYGLSRAEDEVAKEARSLIPSVSEIKSKKKKLVDKKYKNIPEGAKQSIVQSKVLYSIMSENENVIGDWAAPMVLYAKAAERSLSTQLSKLEKFNMTDVHGLGSYNHFLNNHAQSIIEFLDINKQTKFYDFTKDLKEFKDKYRNKFVREKNMSRNMIEELYSFGEGSNLFIPFTEM